MRNALLIFIKNPEKGKVKTRLAEAVGEEKALQIYLALLRHTREVALNVEAERFLFYSSAIEKQDAWPEARFQKFIQQGNDLGERMNQAFKLVLETQDNAVIIGSDCASLTPEIVKMAFAKLEEFPFVIGPALDGGYYLLGMKKPSPELFRDMEWSTEEVCAETINRIEALGESYFLLPELSDIDYWEDWQQYGWEIE